MKYLFWLVLFIPAIIIELFCWITAPIACLFVRKELRTDRVKRLNNETLTFDREYLIYPFSLWATHDNAVDEMWWGKFSHPWIDNKSQFEYDNSRWLRYVCRVLWVWRNTAYGFHYEYFGRPVEDSVVYTKGIKNTGFWYKLQVRTSSFQLQAQIPTGGKTYQDINLGWKEHRGFPKLMYANRIIGFRTYKSKE